MSGKPNMQGNCAECGEFSKSLRRSSGMCTTCHFTSLDVEDGESPTRLTGQWVLNPVTRIRDYVEQVAS